MSTIFDELGINDPGNFGVKKNPPILAGTPLPSKKSVPTLGVKKQVEQPPGIPIAQTEQPPEMPVAQPSAPPVSKPDIFNELGIQAPPEQGKGVAHAAVNALKRSSTGLAIEAAMGAKKLPEQYVPKGFWENAAATGAGLLGDLPEMIAGGIAGTATGAVAGLESGPGAAITAGVGGAAGTFMLPAIVAEAARQKIQHGSVDDYGKIIKTAIEQGGIGALTGFVGGRVLYKILSPEARIAYKAAVEAGDHGAVAKILNESGASKKIVQAIAPRAAEVATFTTAEAAKEGRLPTTQELLTNSAAILGLSISHAVAGKVFKGITANPEKARQQALGRIRSIDNPGDLEALKTSPELLSKFGVTVKDIKDIQAERTAAPGPLSNAVNTSQFESDLNSAQNDLAGRSLLNDMAN